jgi:hypothetical protein
VCALALACTALAAGRAAGEGGAGASPTGEVPSAFDTASIAAACPCAGPLLGGSWRNHAEYVGCVYREARALARALSLRWRDAAPVLRAAASSSCGARRAGEPNVELCTDPGLVLACDVLRSAHAETCDECEAALAGDLVQCARAIDARGTEHRDCASPASGRFPRRGRIVETRSGVDCASCIAKLGSERPGGVACLVADCPPL